MADLYYYKNGTTVTLANSRINNNYQLYQPISQFSEVKFANCDIITYNDQVVTLPLNCTLMFYKITSIDPTKFNTSEVTNMCYMLGNYQAESLDLSSGDISNVNQIREMFAGSSALTSLKISNGNTSKVTNMYGTFRNCTSLTSLDLSYGDASKVEHSMEMFKGCEQLSSILVAPDSNGNDYPITQSGNMFDGCTLLPNFDSSLVDKTRAYNGGDGLGYFSVGSPPHKGQNYKVFLKR